MYHTFASQLYNLVTYKMPAGVANKEQKTKHCVVIVACHYSKSL
jgi:hypothetical protein